MDAFWEYHKAGQLDDSLEIFQQFEHGKETMDFVLNPDSYYYPNVRHNRIIRPKSVDSNAIPVLALEPGMEYQFEPSGIHELQRLALKSAGLTLADIQSVESALQKNTSTVSTASNGVGAGNTFTRLVGSSVLEKGVMIQSAPTVIFNVDRGNTSPDDFTGVALHELVHVAQVLHKPQRAVGSKADAFHNELEAYAVEAKLVESYVVPYSASIAMAGTVEQFRQKFLGADSFDPTDEFVQFAERDDLVGKVLRSLV